MQSYEDLDAMTLIQMYFQADFSLELMESLPIFMKFTL